LILFPYAKDISYIDGELSFVLQFFDSNKTTDIALNIGLEEDLARIIEDLMNQREEV